MKKLLSLALALVLMPSLAFGQAATVPNVNTPSGHPIQAGATVQVDTSGAEKGTTGNPQKTSQVGALPAGGNLIGNNIKSQVFVSTTAVLAANATYTSSTFDLGDVSTPIGYSGFACGARSDAASATTGFQFFQSVDGTNWQYITGASVSAATFPAVAISTITGNLYARYLRVVYINGASPQTIFYLFCRVS